MKLEIRPENSAQATNRRPNPLVEPILKKLTSDDRYGMTETSVRLVDLGCGKLRHLDLCAKFSDHLLLVDTRMQIERIQKFAGVDIRMADFVESLDKLNTEIDIQPINDFGEQSADADVVLCVAVMDVVVKATRVRLAEAAFSNLRRGGYFVVIVPRNDSSILVRCTEDNAFEDGFVFRRGKHNYLTFYTNYRDGSRLLSILEDIGFRLLEDLSVYRQLCFVLEKPG